MGIPPVAIIAFNRPELTRRTFETVRAARPDQLFLVCDGPRKGHPDDRQLCAETRAIFDDIDWPCAVHRRFADVNNGCDRSIELGLDWLFDQVSQAVILEDDCVPDPTFFRYCAELLDRYADQPSVRQISGSSLFVDPRFFHHSYELVPYASIWGWATWARAWQAHRAVFPRRHEPSGSLGPGSTPEWTHKPNLDHLITTAGRRYFAEVSATRDPRTFTWDSYWWLSLVDAKGMCATPRINMVENIGFGPEATSTQSSRVMPEAEAMAFPLRHPDSLAVDAEVGRETELVLSRSNGRWARRLKPFVPQGPLRVVARYIATGPVSVWLVRQLSRAGASRRSVAQR